MRKFFEKFGLLMQIVISTMFIVFILLLMFGALDRADFQNNVVYILFGTFIGLQVIFSIMLLYLQYTADLLSAVMVGNLPNSSVKASITVIRKIVKASTKEIEGVKVGHSKVSIDDKGVALHIKVKLNNRLPEGAIAELRAALTAAFKVRLNLEFCFINFLISSVKFPPNDPAIAEAEAEARAEMAATDTKVLVTYEGEAPANTAQNEESEGQSSSLDSVDVPVIEEVAVVEEISTEKADVEAAQEEIALSAEQEESAYKTYDEEMEDEDKEDNGEAIEAIVLADEDEFKPKEDEDVE